MSFGRWCLGPPVLLSVLALALVTPRQSLEAQEAGEAAVDVARLTAFTRAHLAIARARDAYHGQVGRIHEEQARLEARRRLEATIAGVLEEEDLTREAYDQLTLLVSVDPEARAVFERILAELGDPPGSG